MYDISFNIIFVILFATPFLLTAWNIGAFLYYLIKKKEKNWSRKLEVAAMAIGLLCFFLYADIVEIIFVNWDVPVYVGQRHSPISPDAFPTIAVLLLVALAGYGFLRFVPVRKQPPLASAAGISGVYIGIGICILFCVQTIGDLFLILLPANCILLFVKTIVITVFQKNNLLQNEASPTKYSKWAALLNQAANLPWIALILVVPLLGILVAALFLFGQEPNSIIKAWTETADWTMSQKIPPQNIQYDGHYLCTVAAGGHRRIVKPIRTGVRHGRRVVVNRQLCIANAFEQVLEEKMPALHQWIRSAYDRMGYPISKHIHSKYAADIIYWIMKPLEWLFLLVLYAIDINPEDRIAVQYPHSAIPSLRT